MFCHMYTHTLSFCCIYICLQGHQESSVVCPHTHTEVTCDHIFQTTFAILGFKPWPGILEFYTFCVYGMWQPGQPVKLAAAWQPGVPNCLSYSGFLEVLTWTFHTVLGYPHCLAIFLLQEESQNLVPLDQKLVQLSWSGCSAFVFKSVDPHSLLQIMYPVSSKETVHWCYNELYEGKLLLFSLFWLLYLHFLTWGLQ